MTRVKTWRSGLKNEDVKNEDENGGDSQKVESAKEKGEAAAV